MTDLFFSFLEWIASNQSHSLLHVLQKSFESSSLKLRKCSEKFCAVCYHHRIVITNSVHTLT